MSGLSFHTEIVIHNFLILQLYCELACSMRKERDLVAKLVGHINKSKKQAQQLDKLMDEVHSLNETLWKACKDNHFLAEAL